MQKIYIVQLDEQERAQCQQVIKKLAGSPQKVRRTQMLLKADQGSLGPAWTDEKIAEAFEARRQTVENLRKPLVTEGFDMALNGKPRTNP